MSRFLGGCSAVGLAFYSIFILVESEGSLLLTEQIDTFWGQETCTTLSAVLDQDPQHGA